MEHRESHEAMRAVIGRDTALVAKTVGLSQSTIQHWCVDCGSMKNPLERILEVCRIAKARGKKDYSAPVRFLADSLGFMLVPAPEMRSEAKTISKSFLNTMKEVSEFTAAASAGLEDGKITSEERTIILAEGREAVQKTMVFLRRVQGAV